MKKSSDQTFMLTTSLVTPASSKKTTASTESLAASQIKDKRFANPHFLTLDVISARIHLSALH
jgi:hypothetical protein